MTTRPDTETIPSAAVAATFASWEPAVRAELLRLRELILRTAEETPGVGAIEETLKWGQPSYLTPVTRSGSTVRIAPISPDSDHDYALFFICSTNLVASFKDLFGDTFTYDRDRALLFSLDAPQPTEEVRACIAMALTYHLNKA